MAWLYLLVAGLCEIAWPVGLKLSQTPGRLALGVIIAAVGMTASGALLWLAQRDIPIGTAYAVWTGIGAAGTFAVGIAFYGDSASAWRLVSVGLIVAGIIGLKLAHGSG
jgi:quaternary ammonium compound-resistance protein SugE